MKYTYPLKMSFKIVAIAPQIFIRDASENELFYVHQKAFKLKEEITVYRDQSKADSLYSISADRVIDFSAKYTIRDAAGTTLGALRREGAKSIFKASYLLLGPEDTQTHHIKEDNAWIRVADAVLESIPVVGMISGYLFHPSYTIYDMTEKPLMRLTKKPAFFEGAFEINALDESIDEVTETRLLLSYMMMILLERARG
nr:hypothetical protein [Anaerolineae bacterium]